MLGWNPTDGWQFSWLGAVLAAAALGFAIRKHRLKARRRRSLRRDESGAYVWVDLDGSPGQSCADPRGRWDAEDSADNDGDGGD